MIVNMHEAKTHLSRLVQRATNGEEIVIGKAGIPLAKLVAYQVGPPDRRPGTWRGRVVIAPHFDELPPALTSGFVGHGS